MLGNIKELDPLFFWRRIPTGKKALIKRFDNLVERVFFNLAMMARAIASNSKISMKLNGYRILRFPQSSSKLLILKDFSILERLPCHDGRVDSGFGVQASIRPHLNQSSD